VNALPGGVRLSITILHHPSRAARLPGLLDAVQEGRWVAGVSTDDSGQPPSLAGLAYNFLRAAVPPPGATHHLVLQDDAVPCRDFVRSVGRALQARPQHAVGLYSARAACRRALEQGQSWAELYGELWGLAILMPAGWWREFLQFNRAAFTSNDRFHDDARVALWLAWQGRSTWCTVPSLLDHAAGESLLKHNSRKSRASWALAPHESGLVYDWSKLDKAPRSGVTLRSLIEYHSRELDSAWWGLQGWRRDGDVWRKG